MYQKNFWCRLQSDLFYFQDVIIRLQNELGGNKNEKFNRNRVRTGQKRLYGRA